MPLDPNILLRGGLPEVGEETDPLIYSYIRAEIFPMCQPTSETTRRARPPTQSERFGAAPRLECPEAARWP
jgi:hypothetical protein